MLCTHPCRGCRPDPRAAINRREQHAEEIRGFVLRLTVFPRLIARLLSAVSILQVVMAGSYRLVWVMSGEVQYKLSAAALPACLDLPLQRWRIKLRMFLQFPAAAGSLVQHATVEELASWVTLRCTRRTPRSRRPTYHNTCYQSRRNSVYMLSKGRFRAKSRNQHHGRAVCPAQLMCFKYLLTDGCHPSTLVC